MKTTFNIYLEYKNKSVEIWDYVTDWLETNYTDLDYGVSHCYLYIFGITTDIIDCLKKHLSSKGWYDDIFIKLEEQYV